MSNAKRAIMVPVMTLAVCAIAMIGLGFAITTSVTSDENAVEKLMVDLNDDVTKWNGKYEPTADPVDSLLKIGFKTDKDNNTITKAVDDGYTYAMIFGNITNVKMNVKIGGLNNEKISSVTLSVFTTGSTTDATNFAKQNASPIATVTYSTSDATGNGKFFQTSGETGSIDATFNCNKAYVIAITEMIVNGKTIEVTYKEETVTGESATTTIVGEWNCDEELTSLNSIPSLKYTFTASS